MPAPIAAVESRAEPDGGIGLNRLLSIARLTPAQAGALAADVLGDLETRHAANRPCGPLRAEAVRVCGDGRARLAENGPTGEDATHGAGPAVGVGDPTARPGCLAAAAPLLDELAAAVRPLAADSDQVTTLDRAVLEARRPDGRVAVVVALLRAVDAQQGVGARAELARLVSAATGGIAGERAERGLPPASSVPRPGPRPLRRSPRGIGRALVGRTWKWALSTSALVAVITVEIVFLRADIGRDVQVVLDAGRSGAASTAGPVAAPALPSAPAAGGTIRSVGLRLLERCRSGPSCGVRLQVMLQPQAQPQAVTWAYQVQDRCTGTVTTVPGGTITVPPKVDRADVVTALATPRPRALVVRAVTSRPATAASAPVEVRSDGAACSH
ncbi:MAG TPA: hypothetical protein VI248_11150 [Kineosporiaceae bacterium]